MFISMTPVCKICGAPAACLRLCADHYRERRELEFWGLVDKDDPDGCWLWLGKQRMGYGVFSYGGFPKREQRAHRVAYIWLHGSIPEGLVLDHRCEVKHCVNPAHLEPVTNTENIRRAWAGQPDTESVHRRRRVYGSGSMVEARPGVWKLRWHTGVDPFTGKRTQRQETHHGPRFSLL